MKSTHLCILMQSPLFQMRMDGIWRDELKRSESEKLMEENWQIKGEDEKQQLAMAGVAKDVAEVVHCAFMASAEVGEISRALATNSREEMWNALQKYIERYRLFIVGTSPVTNVTVIDLTKEEVVALSNVEIQHQLKIMTGFIYAYHALNSAFRIAFQECFEKRIKKL